MSERKYPSMIKGLRHVIGGVSLTPVTLVVGSRARITIAPIETANGRWRAAVRIQPPADSPGGFTEWVRDFWMYDNAHDWAWETLAGLSDTVS